MSKMNAGWHEAHPMPRNPSPDQRIAWHLDHAQNCACRPIPKGVLALMEARGLTPSPLRGEGGVRG